MVDRGVEEKILTVKHAVDFNIVGDNISDIAEFTVEKYESKNDAALSPELREKAMKQITDVLWREVEQLKQQHRRVLARMFDAAETTLEEAVAGRTEIRRTGAAVPGTGGLLPQPPCAGPQPPIGRARH